MGTTGCKRPSTSFSKRRHAKYRSFNRGAGSTRPCSVAPGCGGEPCISPSSTITTLGSEWVRGREAAAREYVLDLRFVDPSFALTRQIPWRCIWAALALTAATGAAAMWYAAETASRPRLLAAEVSATLFTGATLAYLAVAVRLVETVALHSLHGRVAVLQYRGGAGTLRRIRPFMRKLGAHVRLAAAARRSTRAEHLRDELREHYRLKEAGVLAGETYDAGKARILAQH